jgi:hypothetical protein
MPTIEFIGTLLYRLALLTAFVASIVWVYRDAKRLGKWRILVAILVNVTWPIGLVVWLFLGSKWTGPAEPAESTHS